MRGAGRTRRLERPRSSRLSHILKRVLRREGRGCYLLRRSRFQGKSGDFDTCLAGLRRSLAGSDAARPHIGDHAPRNPSADSHSACRQFPVPECGARATSCLYNGATEHETAPPRAFEPEVDKLETSDAHQAGRGHQGIRSDAGDTSTGNAAASCRAPWESRRGPRCWAPVSFRRPRSAQSPPTRTRSAQPSMM